MQTNPNPQIESDNWPNFYAILDTQPELEDKELRRVISECYQQASNKMDHRDLSVRFYNQVLTQKVLPACRRILLNPEMRALYDEQLRLHRAGDDSAISYHKFVVDVTQTKSTCLLDANELSILPSIAGQASHSPLQALKVPGMPQQNAPAKTDATTTHMESSISSVDPSLAPTVTQEKAKKPFPLAAIAGVAVLLLGAGGWFMTRSAPGPAAEEAVAATSAAPKKTDGLTPPLMKLNTVAKNSDFEDESSNAWVIATKNNGAFLDKAFNNDAKSGKHVLNFWTKKVLPGAPSRKARVTQQISNLENGTYTMKAWMRRSGKQKKFYMFASDYGGAQRKVDLNLSVPSSWSQLTISNINVTKGQCTIGFYGDNLDEWVNVDAVEFYRS